MDEHMQRRLDKQRKLFKQLGIQLDALSIHEKVFNTKLRGYDSEEVDAYLDEIISDYERFYATISDLMDKWQEQQVALRDIKSGSRSEPERFNIDPKQIEDIVLKMEYNLRQLKTKIRPEPDFFVD
ncbi:DivIVA domain-containing protein [Paenibacillus sp.]|uniref:DivIVA domain-containing protein n=1 Tax=Paenibacillus sp. TaxID=58172 RepID=UPI0028247BE5|nr:DivIVA domain-containing protein [Paenibacillus sp.]MDR0267778.1 DivIVA domain-containing protein [Paenibacillus sp.]